MLSFYFLPPCERLLNETFTQNIGKFLTVRRWRSGEKLGSSLIWAGIGTAGRLIIQRQWWQGVVGLWSRGYLCQKEGEAAANPPWHV